MTTTRAKLTPEQRLARLQDRAAKLKARISKDARRSDAHRKIMLGGLVIAAGVDHWNEAEICAALLGAATHAKMHPEVMERWRAQGIAHLEARAAARRG